MKKATNISIEKIQIVINCKNQTEYLALYAWLKENVHSDLWYCFTGVDFDCPRNYQIFLTTNNNEEQRGL